MKKIALTAALVLPIALGLAACNEAEAPTTDVAEDTTATMPAEDAAAGDAMVDGTVEGDAAATDTSDTVSVSEDGVNASINDGETAVDVNMDEDPSATVTTN